MRLTWRAILFYGSAVKTTVDIDDALLVAAKKHAAEQRRTLRSLIEEGLRMQLSRRSVNRSAPNIGWVVVEGGLPAGIDPADRAALRDWVHRERDSGAGETSDPLAAQ